MLNKTEPLKDNITIVGAGPAGATASMFLSSFGIKHTLIDKAVFPRDKICGDALSGKVLPVLKKLNPGLIQELLVQNENCLGSNGILFGAPNGKTLEVPFKSVHSTINHAPGYVSKRIDFDYSLIKLLNPEYCNFLQGYEVKKITKREEEVTLNVINTQRNETYNVSSSLVIACDGAHSIFNKLFPDHKLDARHYCGGVRAYYSGVKGFHKENFIELHFLKEMLPGYFWIFPLPNGMANVGAGMLTHAIS